VEVILGDTEWGGAGGGSFQGVSYATGKSERATA